MVCVSGGGLDCGWLCLCGKGTAGVHLCALGKCVRPVARENRPHVATASGCAAEGSFCHGRKKGLSDKAGLVTSGLCKVE